MCVAGHGCGRCQVAEIDGLFEESRGGRRGRADVIAAGCGDGRGRGCVQRSGRSQYAVNGEERRADGRRLGHGRRTGGRLPPGLWVAVTRLLRRHLQAAVVSAVVDRGRGRCGHRHCRRPLGTVPVFAQTRGRTVHAVAPEPSVQFHRSVVKRWSRLHTVRSGQYVARYRVTGWRSSFTRDGV